MQSFVKLFLVCFVFCFIGCDNETTDDDTDPTVPVSRSYQWWQDRHNDLINNVIQNQKIIFIGDSLTHFWEGNESWAALNEEYNNKITNLGFAADQTQHVLWRLENGEFPAGINPEYVVLLIGTNNRYEPASTAAGINEIIKVINTNSPSTKILLMSLLPLGSGISDVGTVKNNAVNAINKERYDGSLYVQYLDIAQYYVNTNGALKAELFYTDRLHLSLAGYNLWKEKLMEIIE
jgi:N-acetylglucosamine-6-sulfatase